ncbi:hypothetical protein BGW42_001046 [Actinomortierella wolfii]|nr:hypothetical protein BGW42_001046 [Actinomortierella wolfii]
MVNGTLEDTVNEFGRPGYNLLATLQSPSADSGHYTPHGQHHQQQSQHHHHPNATPTGGTSAAAGTPSSPVTASTLTAASLAAAAAVAANVNTMSQQQHAGVVLQTTATSTATTDPTTAVIANSVRTLSETEQAAEIRKMTGGLGISMSDFAAMHDSADLLQPPEDQQQQQQQQHPGCHPMVRLQPPQALADPPEHDGGGGIGAAAAQPLHGAMSDPLTTPTPAASSSSSAALKSQQDSSARSAAAPRKQVQRRGERSARQIQPLNTIFYPNPLEGPVLVPNQEQEFESLEAAQAAAERYAKSVGTVAIVKRTTKDKLGNVVQRDLACERQGFYLGQNKKTASLIKTKRCGCPWMISVGFSKKRGNREGKRGRFTKIVLEHNHEVGQALPETRHSPAVKNENKNTALQAALTATASTASSSGGPLAGVSELPEDNELGASSPYEPNQAQAVTSQVPQSAMDILQEEVRHLASRTGLHPPSSPMTAYNGANADSANLFATTVHPGLQLQHPASLQTAAAAAAAATALQQQASTQHTSSTGDAVPPPTPSPTTTTMVTATTGTENDDSGHSMAVTMEDVQMELAKLPSEWMRRDVLNHMMRVIKLAQQTYHVSSAAGTAASATGDNMMQAARTALTVASPVSQPREQAPAALSPSVDQPLTHQVQQQPSQPQRGRPMPSATTWSTGPQTTDTRMLSEMLTVVGGGGGGNESGSPVSVNASADAITATERKRGVSRNTLMPSGGVQEGGGGHDRSNSTSMVVDPHPSSTTTPDVMLTGIHESLLPAALASADTASTVPLHHPQSPQHPPPLHGHRVHHHHHQSIVSSTASSAIPTSHITPVASSPALTASHMAAMASDMAANIMLHVSSAPTTSSVSTSTSTPSPSLSSTSLSPAIVSTTTTSPSAMDSVTAVAAAAATSAVHGSGIGSGGGSHIHTTNQINTSSSNTTAGVMVTGDGGAGGGSGNVGDMTNGSVLSFTHMQGVLTTSVASSRETNDRGHGTSAVDTGSNSVTATLAGASENGSGNSNGSQQELLRHLAQQSTTFQFMVNNGNSGNGSSSGIGSNSSGTSGRNSSSNSGGSGSKVADPATSTNSTGGRTGEESNAVGHRSNDSQEGSVAPVPGERSRKRMKI